MSDLGALIRRMTSRRSIRCLKSEPINGTKRVGGFWVEKRSSGLLACWWRHKWTTSCKDRVICWAGQRRRWPESTLIWLFDLIRQRRRTWPWSQIARQRCLLGYRRTATLLPHHQSHSTRASTLSQRAVRVRNIKNHERHPAPTRYPIRVYVEHWYWFSGEKKPLG